MSSAARHVKPKKLRRVFRRVSPDAILGASVCLASWRDRLDLRQPRQCLDCAPDGFKLVMGVNNIHVGRSVPGELLAQLLADTGIRERAVKRVP